MTSRALLSRAVAALIAGAAPVTAQDTSQAVAAGERELRVFFDCNARCVGNYLRTETPWVDFVRDRTDADVHVLITSLDTGAGGERYTINLVGLGAFAPRSDMLTFVLHAGDTDQVGRRGLTRTIQLGLGPYVARTRAASAVRMSLDDEVRREETPAASRRDPWRSWVFEFDGSGSLEEEQRQSRFSWGGSFDARRITSRWKSGVSMNASFNQSRFLIEGDAGEPDQRITSLRESYSAGAVAVRSHGAHWGSGMQLTASSSTFSNTSLALRAGPAIEYSVFPYDDFTRRQLTLQYSAGISTFRYRDTTIFGRIRETRPTHALVLGYDVTQQWGEAELTIETARYMDNSAQWRLEVDGDVEVRVTRGLAIEFGGGASLIRDQLAIAARDATPEEVLLELRDLQTDYRYGFFVGLSYTFGSIFNTVVNPRFGTGPGTILR